MNQEQKIIITNLYKKYVTKDYDVILHQVNIAELNSELINLFKNKLRLNGLYLTLKEKADELKTILNAYNAFNEDISDRTHIELAEDEKYIDSMMTISNYLSDGFYDYEESFPQKFKTQKKQYEELNKTIKDAETLSHVTKLTPQKVYSIRIKNIKRNIANLSKQLHSKKYHQIENQEQTKNKMKELAQNFEEYSIIAQRINHENNKMKLPKEISYDIHKTIDTILTNHKGHNYAFNAVKESTKLNIYISTFPN